MILANWASVKPPRQGVFDDIFAHVHPERRLNSRGSRLREPTRPIKPRTWYICTGPTAWPSFGRQGRHAHGFSIEGTKVSRTEISTYWIIMIFCRMLSLVSSDALALRVLVPTRCFVKSVDRRLRPSDRVLVSFLPSGSI